MENRSDLERALFSIRGHRPVNPSIDKDDEIAIVVRLKKMDWVRTVSLLFVCFFSLACHAEVFSELRVSFSVTGRRFDDGAGDAVSYAYVADTAMTVGRNVSVALGQRVGRFVKLHLHFADQWILISELYFQSGQTAPEKCF